MSYFDKVKNAIEEDAKKIDTPLGVKVVKYVCYGIVGIVILSLATCTFRSCVSSPNKQINQVGTEYPSQQIQQPQPVQQPYVQQGSGLSTMESMALGALGGYVIGKTLMPNGQVYQGTPEQRTYVKNYYVEHPKEVPKDTKPAAPVVAPTPPKVKNPGDVAAEAEKAKMQAEQAQKAKQEALKAELRAKQEARAAQAVKSTPAPTVAPKPTSSFNSFSKSIGSSSPSRSFSSSPSRSSSSGGRR